MSAEWSDQLRAYLRAAEVRLAQQECLEGTLTMIGGFLFSGDNPYTYEEAKCLLNLALEEFRKDLIVLALGRDPKAPGRTAITVASVAVSNFLPLKDRPKRGTFARSRGRIRLTRPR